MQVNTISTNNTHRVNSLDILRSIAILLVILYHYDYYVLHKNTFGIVGVVGWIGVDLFFVLSGYLISNQIFTAIIAKRFSLKLFYIKRLFKILPNYYIVLILYFMVPHFTENPITVPFWNYFIFIQNFNSNLHHSGFSHSWSLGVEEQFYLIFPFLAMWLCRKNRHFVISLLISVVLFGIVLRGMLWHNLFIMGNITQFAHTIYYPIYCRLDGFIFGILVAYLQNYYSQIWQIITRYSNVLLVIGLASLMYFITTVTTFNGFSTVTIGYPGIAFSFAIIMLSALSPKSLLTKCKVFFLSKLAQWSYAIYLLQKPVSELLANYFSHIGWDNNAYLVIVLNISIQILAGYILFSLVESKFMLLRNKVINRLS